MSDFANALKLILEFLQEIKQEIQCLRTIQDAINAALTESDEDSQNEDLAEKSNHWEH